MATPMVISFTTGVEMVSDRPNGRPPAIRPIRWDAPPGRCEEKLTVAGDNPLIGGIGGLTVATRGQAGPGEVLVKIRGGSEAFIAYSPEPLPKGSTVLVINDRGTRCVDVSAWDDPINSIADDSV